MLLLQAARRRTGLAARGFCSCRFAPNAGFLPPESLFRPQGQGGIDVGDAPCWGKAGGQRGEDQKA
jgi:hypothetical protein